MALVGDDGKAVDVVGAATCCSGWGREVRIFGTGSELLMLLDLIWRRVA